MSLPTTKPAFRVVVTSFAAGAGAMVLAGLVIPVAVQGGLSIRDAVAATFEAQAAPEAIEPLDVVAIQARVAEAERGIEAARLASEDAIARLDRLSARRS
jgi:hypothetical protein